MSTVAVIQQLDRFQGAHRYHGKQPLRELLFSLTVWRAPLIEEELRELLCETKFQWGAKLPSPNERIGDVQHWIRNTASRPSGTMSAGVALGDTEMLRRPADGGGDFDAGQYEMPRHPLVDLLCRAQDPQTPGSTAERMAEFCQRGEHRFFTRPPAEDYVDPTEFISPLEPEQATSPLAAIVLSNHRTQHRGNPNMYLMWAMGQAEAALTAGRRSLPKGCDPVAAAQLPLELLDMSWVGDEVVFCTLTRQANSDTSFLVKPSLNEEHTLLVTSKHIYTFKLSVVQATTTTGGGGGGGATPRPSVERPLSSSETPRRQRDVERLISGSADGSISDVNAQLYVTDASERQRRVLLRQAVFRGRGTTVNTGSMSDASFTPAPSPGDGTSKHPAMKRVHYFGTIEHALGVPTDSLVLRMRWLLPEGAIVDEASRPSEGSPVHGPTPTTIVSQLAFGCRILNAEYMYDTQHNFNLPFELTVLMPVDTRRHVAAAVTVFARGSGGDDYAEPAGYGAAWFSSVPGIHRKQTFGLWKPRKTGYEFLRSIFLGGGPALADEEIITLPPSASGSSSKLGLVCESSGTVAYGYHVVVHSSQGKARGPLITDAPKPAPLQRPAAPPPSLAAPHGAVGEFDPTQRSLARAARGAHSGNGGRVSKRGTSEEGRHHHKSAKVRSHS